MRCGLTSSGGVRRRLRSRRMVRPVLSFLSYPLDSDVAFFLTTGWATFKAPSKSVSIWTKKDARGRETF